MLLCHIIIGPCYIKREDVEYSKSQNVARRLEGRQLIRYHVLPRRGLCDVRVEDVYEIVLCVSFL